MDKREQLRQLREQVDSGTFSTRMLRRIEELESSIDGEVDQRSASDSEPVSP